jgi:CRISPR/Cas system-associated exonuclease Cas4 (RecB family)
VAVAVSVAVTVSVDGSAVGVVGVSVGVGVVVAPAAAVAELTADAARLVALPIALFALLVHPATRHPATSMATGRAKPLFVHRIPGPFRMVN